MGAFRRGLRETSLLLEVRYVAACGRWRRNKAGAACEGELVESVRANALQTDVHVSPVCLLGE